MGGWVGGACRGVGVGLHRNKRAIKRLDLPKISTSEESRTKEKLLLLLLLRG